MSSIANLDLVLPCPSCCVRRSLCTSERLATAAQGGSSLLLHECARCWSRRARILNEARQGLRERGELRDSHGVLTWHGERLNDHREHDGLADALASELLRRDIPPMPSARIALPAQVPDLVEEAARG